MSIVSQKRQPTKPFSRVYSKTQTMQFDQTTTVISDYAELLARSQYETANRGTRLEGNFLFLLVNRSKSFGGNLYANSHSCVTGSWI